MIRRTPIAVLPALRSAGVAACSEPELPAIRYESDRVRVGTGFSEPLCAVDLVFLDAHVAFVESMTGARHDGPIDVYIYDDPEELPCRTSPFGCYNYDRDFAAALWQFVDHECARPSASPRRSPRSRWRLASRRPRPGFRRTRTRCSSRTGWSRSRSRCTTT